MLIGLLIVAVIAIIYFVATRKTGGSSVGWRRVDYINYAGDLSGTNNGSLDGNVRYLGSFGDLAGCEKICGDDAWCKGYTWIDKTAAATDGQCYGVSNVKPASTLDKRFHSGYRSEGFSVTHPRVDQDPKYSNTLLRRQGMGSAADSGENFRSKSCVGTFDCLHNEMFRNKTDVASNTMYGGYYHNAALPG